MTNGAKRAGLLLRVDGTLNFLPASVAVQIAPPPRITPVPGSPPELLGVALHRGSVVPVLAVGSERAEMVVCQHAGELLGIVGGRVVGTGTFACVSGKPEAVEHAGEAALPLDVAAVYARVQTGAFAFRR